MSTNGDNSSVRSGITKDSTDWIRRWIEGDNKTLVHSWIEESNKGSAAIIDTTRCVYHDPTDPKVCKDFKQLLTEYHPSLKDSNEMVAVRDRVVAHLTWTSHTNKQETFTTVSTFRIANRKIVEFWLDEAVDQEKKDHFRWLSSIVLYGLLPLGAVTLIVIQTFQAKFLINVTTLILLFVAILPFLPKFLESAKLPGGWELIFRKIPKIEAEQIQQKAEIQSQQTQIGAIKLILDLIVTKYELDHLQNFNRPEPFFAKNSGNFIAELRHLHFLGLIERIPGQGFRLLEEALRQFGRVDVKGYFKIADKGKEYVEKQKQIRTEL